MRLLQPKEGPKCKECPLYGIGIVIMDRLPALDFSGLTVVGEMAGKYEVEHRSVFVGPTGRLFRAICDAIDVPIDSLHVTNCIACGMEKGGRPEDKEVKKIIECCTSLLKHNMRVLGTKVACATGAVPWEALSGLKGINKYRGCVIPAGEREPWDLTATLHPAGLLQNEATRIGVENVRYDVRKAYDMALGTRKLWDPDVRDANDVDDLFDFLTVALEDEWVLAVDVETDGIDPWACNLTTIGIAGASHKNDEPESWSIPWGPAFPGFFTNEQWKHVLALITEIHANSNQTIIFHNFTYDVPVLRRHLGIEITADVQDTLLLDHCCYPKLPHNLQNLASRYLVVEPWKDDFRASEKELNKRIEEEYKLLDTQLGMVDEEAPEETYLGAVHIDQLDEQGVGELLWYNATDTAATWKIYWLLLQEAHELNTYKVYLEDMELAREAMNWTETGIRIDMDKCEELDAEYSLELIERKGRLQ
jgi:uracil-DNA glycosylase family 4